MKVVALISGGKDSSYNVLQCIAAGHEVVALANLLPKVKAKDELDSFMYQTVGHQGVNLYAEAAELPLFREVTGGLAHHQYTWYTPTEGDEVEDLYNLLARVKNEMNVEGVSTGAILSDYQRIRVENVCSRLGLVSLAYLWKRDQTELLQEMVNCGLEAIIIKVAALGLEPSKHLGMRLQDIQPHLLKMNRKYGLNVCGEGGEYETFTLDCPFFSKRIVVDEFEIVIHSDDAFAPVGYINFKKLSLVDKKEQGFHHCTKSSTLYLSSLVKGPSEYADDLETTDEFLHNSSVQDHVKTLSSDEAIEDLPLMDDSTIIDDRHSNMSVVFESLSPKICVHTSGWFWLGSVIGTGSDPCIALCEALKTLNDLLSSKNYSVRDLVCVTLFVSDMSLFAQLNSTYSNVIDADNAPARICLQTKLPENAPILIDAVAHKVPILETAATSVNTDNERHRMHVQSISHWAPANIGPYSQSVMIGDNIYIAGQIALIPGTMQMAQGGIDQECRLSLRHVARIVNAMDQNALLRDVVQVISFVTDSEYVQSARREWEKRSNNAIVDYFVISALPKNAKIEWQVWAHRGNACFQYEETGRRIDRRYKTFLRRRYNYENTVSAVVCHLTKDNNAEDKKALSEKVNELEILQVTHVEDTINYTLNKLFDGEHLVDSCSCSLKIFYPMSQCRIANFVHNVLLKLAGSLPFAYTLIPVLHLCDTNTVLSICATRHCN